MVQVKPSFKYFFQLSDFARAKREKPKNDLRRQKRARNRQISLYLFHKKIADFFAGIKAIFDKDKEIFAIFKYSQYHFKRNIKFYYFLSQFSFSGKLRQLTQVYFLLHKNLEFQLVSFFNSYFFHRCLARCWASL